MPLVRTPAALPDAPFTPLQLVSMPGWREVGLWWHARRALIVPEAIGSNPAFAVGPGPLGVHVLLRLKPPRVLRGYAPQHVLVGHGLGVHGANAAPALRDALDRSRRDLPRFFVRLPSLLRA